MSSSLNELRNFRLNKVNSNGSNSSSKLASGRKRIRAMSDSSDDEHTKKQPTTSLPKPQPTENGTSTTLSVKDKEERYHIFRQIVDSSVDALILQDFLVQNNWDVQKAFDALLANPKYSSKKHSTPDSVQSPSKPLNSANFSPTETISSNSTERAPPREQKQNKVKFSFNFTFISEELTKIFDFNRIKSGAHVTAVVMEVVAVVMRDLVGICIKCTTAMKTVMMIRHI